MTNYWNELFASVPYLQFVLDGGFEEVYELFLDDDANCMYQQLVAEKLGFTPRRGLLRGYDKDGYLLLPRGYE